MELGALSSSGWGMLLGFSDQKRVLILGGAPELSESIPGKPEFASFVVVWNQECRADREGQGLFPGDFLITLPDPEPHQ